MKKILILGGTGFVGRILTENLISEGMSPVLFNRGKRNPDIFPELRKITGDRLTGDIKKIGDESWDIVIDFSCMFPDNLDEITEMLKGKAGRYIFISTASVYPMDNPLIWSSPVKEDAVTLQCTPEERKNPDVMTTYGQKKAECERVLLGKDWLDSVIFRPGLIYGRYDYTDRFYYWLYRAKKNDRILIPDEGREKFTCTYSEDFAKLIRKAIDINSHNRIYNAVTHLPVSLKDYADTSCRLLGRKPEIISGDTAFLEENKVQPWSDLPAWVGEMDMALDNSKARKDLGIKFESFEKSLVGCIKYYDSLGWKEPAAGLSTAREAELIEKLLSA